MARFKPYMLRKRGIVTTRFIVVEETFEAVRAIYRPLVLPGVTYGVLDASILNDHLPGNKGDRYELDNTPLQSELDNIRSSLLAHGGTPEAVRLFLSLADLSKEELQMAKEKLQTKGATKADKPAKETKAPAAAGAKKGNVDALNKAREAKAANAGPDTRKLKILNKENPYREGSNRAAAFAALTGAKTVQDYLDNGGKAKYLTRWADEERITLG